MRLIAHAVVGEAARLHRAGAAARTEPGQALVVLAPAARLAVAVAVAVSITSRW